MHRMITMDARPDRQTDEHHGNSVTIRSMNASRAKTLITGSLRAVKPSLLENAFSGTFLVSTGFTSN